MHRHPRGDEVVRTCGSRQSPSGRVRSGQWMAPTLAGCEPARRERSRDGRERGVHRGRGCDPSIEGMSSFHGGGAIPPSRACARSMEELALLDRGNAIAPRRDAVTPSTGRHQSIDVFSSSNPQLENISFALVARAARPRTPPRSQPGVPRHTSWRPCDLLPRGV
jgi:hypothetical protein